MRRRTFIAGTRQRGGVAAGDAGTTPVHNPKSGASATFPYPPPLTSLLLFSMLSRASCKNWAMSTEKASSSMCDVLSLPMLSFQPSQQNWSRLPPM